MIATPDHSRMLIRVSAEAAQDKGEMRLLFGWQESVRQRDPRRPATLKSKPARCDAPHTPQQLGPTLILLE
jgi:hypothetical protein